jgi:hypothetical protein
MRQENSKKWNVVYTVVILANIAFAIAFYMISAVYGNS